MHGLGAVPLDREDDKLAAAVTSRRAHPCACRYDNEWGYSNRLVDLCVPRAALLDLKVELSNLFLLKFLSFIRRKVITRRKTHRSDLLISPVLI